MTWNGIDLHYSTTGRHGTELVVYIAKKVPTGVNEPVSYYRYYRLGGFNRYADACDRLELLLADGWVKRGLVDRTLVRVEGHKLKKKHICNGLNVKSNLNCLEFSA